MGLTVSGGSPGWWSIGWALLLPPLCQVCDAALGPEEVLCDGCLSRWSWLRAGCLCCGADLFEVMEVCPRCAEEPPPWRSARSLVVYEGAVTRAVQAMKFRGRRQLAQAVGSLLGAQAPALGLGVDAALVTWVPVSPGRLRRRGYDQARLMAEAAARVLELPAAPTLSRRRVGRAQSGQGRSRRAENTDGAFERLPGVEGLLAGRSILLVDDVLTTGATGASCAARLLEGGATAVDLLTFARAP